MSRGIFLLLACFLLLTVVISAYAQESNVTVTTDKTTYNPGQTVYVTVEVNGPVVTANWGFLMKVTIQPPPPASAIPGGSTYVGGTGSYELAATLPTNAVAGNYSVMVQVSYLQPSTGVFTVIGVGPTVGITVT